jgi:molybdopterin molybdotransferase
MLTAQVATTGAEVQYLGIARDQPEDLHERIAIGLKSSILVLSGGVSAGKLDLVPGILTSLGVEARFHKVAMKPGKPVFFGVRAADTEKTLVFGLPGNPVSSFVAFELFVRPAIRTLHGDPDGVPLFEPLPLAADFSYSTDRPTYHPATVSDHSVRPVEWRGSPDLRALTLADALCLLPAGERIHKAGDLVPTYQWRRFWTVR